MPVPPERHWWIRLRIWIAEIWTIEAPRIAADTVLAIWIPRKNVAHIGIRRGCRLVRLAQARPGTGKDWPLLHHIALGHGDRTDASRYRRRTATCYRRRCRPEQTHHQRRAERGFARRQSSPARERVFSKSASPALAGCPFERVMTLATLIGRGNSSAALSIR